MIGTAGEPAPAGDTLPLAPASVVDAAGAPALGAYAGFAGEVDWSKLRPPHRTGRLWRMVHAKRWHYASVAAADYVLAAAIIDIGWATSAFAYLFDRREKRLLADLSWLGLPGLSARVSAAPRNEGARRRDSAGARAHPVGCADPARWRERPRAAFRERPNLGHEIGGCADPARWRERPRAAFRERREPTAARSTFRGIGGSLSLEEVAGGWRLTVSGKLTVDAELAVTPSTATLCAVAAIDGGVANCTHKTVCLAARGEASAGGKRFDLAGGAAAIDHTHGLLARDTRWRWASASGERVGLNLVEGFNGPVENALWIDGRLHPVGAASFDFRPEAPLEPWRIRTADGRVDLTFTPEGARAEDKNLGFAVSRYVQPIGTFRGTVRGSGETLPIELVGVTENHIARW